MKVQVPPSVVLFAATVHGLQAVSPLLEKGTPHYINFQGYPRQKSLENHPAFSKSELLAQYIQVILLTALTLHGGVLVPSLKQVVLQEKGLVLTWEGGIRDQITLGVFDEAFQKFFKFFQRKVLQVKAPIPEVTLAFLDQTMAFIRQKSMSLVSCSKAIETLTSGSSGLIESLEAEFRSDFLFTLLSSLPTESLNALFLYLVPFFPEDLNIKTPQGHVIQVTSLFQAPSVNIQSLLEKTQLYYQLYLSDELPIIREITRSKTREFLKDLLQNPMIYASVSAELKSINTMQLQPRLQLYTCVIKQFEA